MAKHYGLVGKQLSHSFSRAYFEKKFADTGRDDLSYINFELPEIEDIKRIVQADPLLAGLNITVPYKTSVIPFLDDIDETAEKIGAVNCIKIRERRLMGYNTDAYGFAQSIKPFLDPNHAAALILGTGGASKAVAYVLNQLGVDYFFVTSGEKRSGKMLSYTDLNAIAMNKCRLIVNTTPVGTYPHTDQCPDIPYEYFSSQHLAYDLVYNPEQTLFLKRASEKGAITVNGLSMLYLQAEKSWEIWND